MLVGESASSTRAGSYRDRLAAGIRPYQAGDREELEEFLQSMHGERAHEARPDYIEWLAKGPPLRADSPRLWVYRHEGRIVARQAAMPVALKVGRRVLDAAWAVHLVVDPRHQLRGIGSVLSTHCFAGYDVTLGLEVSDAARRAYRRAGWVDLGTVPLFLRILDPARAVARKWPDRRWLRPAAQLARMPLAVIDAILEARAATRPLDSEEVERFDSSIDVLFDRLGDAYPVIARRDSATLNWRFAEYPPPNGYRRLVFRHHGEVVGYAVLRLETTACPMAGHIVDWFCAPSWTWFVLARCLGLLRRWGAAVAYSIVLAPGGERALRQLGFIERASGRPLMFRGRDLPYDLMALMCRRQSWFVTAGDSDVDRPREHTRYPGDREWVVQREVSPSPDRPRRAG